MQLDDWVLCRIYNKKGKIEKYNDTKPIMFSKEVEFENETKPKIEMNGQDDFRIINDQLYIDTSDSVPQFHTDSSCSEHVVSPDVMYDKEVQSEPKWNEFVLGPDPVSAFDFQLNFMDDGEDDYFTPQVMVMGFENDPLGG
ncbi:hypothetical protein TSUD_70510 [Trifolium subterraneum]|uniref:NAC domain-containing protein n=1 Tax=Trifolium subterraneum TaxID=3900 RepID=A0A2Z6N206_TRISU|nr:hypothetical protein TSUD_70510 [Trifolium subterraneum]